jgi:periplasmic divalent cation tolerance protein
MKECIVVLVSAKDEDEAAHIATALADKNLAACCNIIKGVRSIYRWEGVIEDGVEALLVIKSRRELFSALEAEVKRLHSYSTPEIVALPIIEGSEAYLSWIEKST